MNQEYIIIDPRPLEAFKDKTFSGFKKRDVFNTLMKCIEKGLIEPACYWVTECIVSGYSQELFDKLDIMANNIGMANVCHTPLLWIFTRGQGIKLLSFIAKECRKINTFMPDLPKVMSNDGYEGAIVLPPKVGLYRDKPVAVNDY